jgi:hypothetical protein
MSNSTNKLVSCFLFVMAATSLAISEPALSRATTRFAISTERVVYAMASAGIDVSPDQIEILSQVHSSTQSAPMTVVSVSKGGVGTGTIKARLRCDHHECLPFYVLVHGFDRTSDKIPGIQSAPGPSADKLPSVVRGGDHATLVLQSPDSQMSFPVVCLQSGMPGQKIRVASLDHRRYYDAEIVTAGMLKGTF